MARNDQIDKLLNLRALCEKDDLDGYILSNNDACLSEYSLDEENDLKKYTGFSGSAGVGVFYKNKFHLFTDGRYEIQAKKQMPAGSEIHILPKVRLENWLNEKISKGNIFGVNYKKSPNASFRSIKTFAFYDIPLDKRSKINQKIFLLDKKFHGCDSNQKILELKKNVKDLGYNSFVIEDLDSISWLLNIRGDYYSFNPVVFAKAIYRDNKLYLYIPKNNLDNALINYLDFLGVALKGFEEFYSALYDLDASKTMIEHNCSLAVRNALSKANIVISPIMYNKAIKNAAEIEYSKAAHIDDASAIAEFLRWFRSEYVSGKYHSEFELSKKLKSFRAKSANFFSESFPAIVGFRENGAVIHYRPEIKDSKKVEGDGLLLIDSGGQYYGGTTDVTRVFCIGEPTKDQIKKYTQVLMGHIDAASYIFAEGETGKTVDALARKYLLEEEKNYAHGTGHGVGSFLNVHEGPYSISPNSFALLKEGVILSIEPGYYQEGEYGIRIENLYLVQKNQKGDFFFEPLTLFPFEEKLIDYSILRDSHKKWLQYYYDLIWRSGVKAQ